MLAYVALVKISEKHKKEPQPGHDENIDYGLVSIDKIQEMIKEGKIKDMGFLAALTLARNIV